MKKRIWVSAVVIFVFFLIFILNFGYRELDIMRVCTENACRTPQPCGCGTCDCGHWTFGGLDVKMLRGKLPSSTGFDKCGLCTWPRIKAFGFKTQWTFYVIVYHEIKE